MSEKKDYQEPSSRTLQGDDDLGDLSGGAPNWCMPTGQGTNSSCYSGSDAGRDCMHGVFTGTKECQGGSCPT